MTDEVIESRNGRLQKREAGQTSFTAAKRKRFLDALALTCNVRRSAAFAGLDRMTAYHHRARDPVFAEQWNAALLIGYDRLEALVLEHGGAGERLDDPDPDRAEADPGAPPPFDFDRALKVLGHYLKKRDGQGGTGSGRFRHANREDTNAALMKALAAAKRRVERSRTGDA